ncbi:P-loop containing nucleoside triphosphate hydrolase protein [Mycena galericulata]|nr:P-loop containing nucleoside triphosphate hydrolase protein [Mycena galericulata]
MDTSLKTLRDYSKARLDILKQLRDAKIQQEVDLPHIVAVGVQSAGKSSVIEAISTLKLPRGVGTCTKCPMEFRLEHSTVSQTLSVDITLRFGQSEDIPFRTKLSGLDDIRSAIGEAQESILNPSLVGRGTGDSTRTFSEDCVCVVAKGPNMPDLYFYDIPGDPTQIDLIKRLITRYVKKPNCIVLLVVSCEYDLEIGGVAPIIFDSDVDAKARTVGVLTKVDRMADGMEPTWLETFNNNGPHKLDNGWFAVKLPSRDHIPWETARQQEREWFENNNLSSISMSWYGHTLPSMWEGACQRVSNENIDHCGDDTVVELDRLAARELAPSTVLKAEYSVLQTTICQQYRHALAPDSAPEASLLSVTADLFKAFILKNNTSIAGELAAGVISAATQQSFLDHIATASRQGGDSHAVYGATADKDLNNALEVMSSVQAYLELASKRFADVATNCIDDSFLRTLYERVDNALRALPFNNSPEMCLQLIQDPTIVEQRRSLKERRIQFAGVYNTLNNAMRDLKREIPDLHVRTQSQSAAPEPQAQDNSDSEASFAQVSVDSSNSK